jgi:hypothetical protein
MDTGTTPPGPNTGQPSEAALLKEYESCSAEAAGTSNWIWASTTIFVGAWVAALGVLAAQNADNDLTWQVRWALAGSAVIAQIIWMMFIERSLRVRQYLFVRQRQIENRLGMLKSWGMFLHDMAAQPQRRQQQIQNLTAAQREQFEKFDEWAADVDRGVGRWERCLHGLSTKVEPCFGHGGRAALYLLSILVAASWITFAAIAQAYTVKCLVP